MSEAPSEPVSADVHRLAGKAMRPDEHPSV